MSGPLWVPIHPGKDPEETVQEARAKQVAALALTGMGTQAIADSLGIDLKTVKRTMNTEEYKAVVKQAGDVAFATALNQLRMETRIRLKKAFEVLDKALEKDSLPAAIQVFKMIDKDTKEEKQTGDTVINIAMPRNTEPEPTTIETTATEVDE